jgi:RNA polymerase sigma factor (sigma-70 family)
MRDDAELLRTYAETKSEEAFAELVQRHLGAVYAVAYRRVGGNVHLAKEVAQSVFTDLARKAATLTDRPVLVGWLFVSTRYAAADAVRREGRRGRLNERAAAMSELPSEASPEPDWDQLRPTLDDALHELNDRDRVAVLLRFFENQSFAQVAGKLRLTENGARMRVERALEKLRRALGRRGISSSAAALAAALGAQASVTVPTGLATAVMGGALTAAAGGGASLALTLMSLSKVQLAAAAAVVLAAASTGVMEYRMHQRLEGRAAELRPQSQAVQSLRTDNARLRQQLAALSAAPPNSSRAPAALGAARPLHRSPSVKPIYTLAEALAAAPIVDASKVDQQPVVIDQVAPHYPPEMRKGKISGQVMVSFIVAVDGGVIEPQVNDSSRPEFEEAALKAVSLWLFEPGALQGNIVNTRMQVPIIFSAAPKG